MRSKSFTVPFLSVASAAHGSPLTPMTLYPPTSPRSHHHPFPTSRLYINPECVFSCLAGLVLWFRFEMSLRSSRVCIAGTLYSSGSLCWVQQLKVLEEAGQVGGACWGWPGKVCICPHSTSPGQNPLKSCAKQTCPSISYYQLLGNLSTDGKLANN